MFFTVTEQITTYTPVWNTYPELTYGPFDLVTLINNSELASLQEVTGGDQFCVLPAIFFKFAKDKQFNDNAIQATALTFDAITIFTGPGNVVKAYKAGRIAIALLEGSMVLGSAGNIVANSLPNGSVAKEYITRYNLVISILGAGRSVITGGSKLKSLTQNAWNGSLNYPGLKLADVDYLINNFETAKNILKSNLNVAQFSSLKRVKNYLAKIRKGGNNIDNLAGGAGSSLFGKNVIAVINGFSDNVTTLASQYGLSLNEFKSLELEAASSLAKNNPQGLNKILSIRNSIPNPDAGTIMQKVIPLDKISDFTVKGYKPRGFVTTAANSKHLDTYEEIYDGLRLDYKIDNLGTQAFHINDNGCYVIRFKASNANQAIPAVNLMSPDPFPYTNHGFTSGMNGKLGVPEWKIPDAEITEGVIYLKQVNGNEIEYAIFDKILNKFVLK